MNRFLIIANHLLGDGLDTFPALDFIFRYLPAKTDKNQYDLLAYRYTESLYKNFPFDRVFLTDKKLDYLDQGNKLSFIKNIQHVTHLLKVLKGRYTAVIIFPGSFGWGVWARLLHVQFIVGHKHDYRSLFLTHPVRYSRNQPNYQSFLSLAEKFVSLFTADKIYHSDNKKSNQSENSEIVKIRKSLPTLIPSASLSTNQWEKKIQNKLNGRRKYFSNKSLSQKLPFTKNLFKDYVVISPTASENNKTWSGEKFFQIAEKVSFQGYTVFWVGLGKEYQLIDKVSQGGKVGYNLAGDLPLTEVFSLIKGSHGFIGNDSGLAHAAAMLGVATVVIYGPTNPTLSRPLTGIKNNRKMKSNNSNLYQIFHEHAEISHQQRRKKFFQEIFDINLITIDEVWGKIQNLFPNLRKIKKKRK